MNTGDAKEELPSTDNLTGLQDFRSMAGFTDIAFDAVVAFDAQERIIYWNPAAEQMYGWTAQEAIGKTTTKLFCQAGTSREQEKQRHIQSRLKQSEILRGEANLCRKDGSSLGVEYTARGFFDGAGNLTGYVAVYRDISTQMQAHEKIGESQRKFSVLFDKVGFAAALSQPPNGVLVDVNEAWVETFGYTRNEAIGKTTLELNINPDAEGRARMLAQLQEKGSARNVETTLRTKSGEWRVFLTNLDLVEIDGQTFILNTTQDITDRKRAEEALRASEERYRVVIESALDAIVVTNPSQGGKVLAANPAACRMFGYTKEEFKGLAREDMLDRSDPNLETLLEQRKQLGHASAELTYKRKDGTRFLGELSSVLYRDQNGEERAVAIIRDITQRKRAEEQLERSNQRLSEILESIQDDFYVLDRDWNFVYASPLFTSKVGKEPKDFVGHNLWKMFPKHVGTILEENFRVAMEKREVRRFEIGGKYTNAWYRMTAFPSAEGITVLGTDITQRKQAEERLYELSQRLTYHVDNSPLAVIEWGPDMRLIRWSSAAERIFGWKAEEVLGKRMEDFRWIYEEDTRQVEDVSADLQTGTDPKRFSANRNYRKDGSVAYCEWYNSSLLDEAGNLRSILSLVLDVTDRTHAEQQLQYQAALLANVNDAIIALDAEYRITAWNSAAESLYGWKAEEVIGRNGAEIVQTEWSEQDASEMRRMIAETGHWRGEAIQVRKDGSRFPVEVSSIVLYDEVRRVLGFVSVNRDITQRKRAEEELRQSEERYRHLVQYAPAAIYEIDIQTGRFVEVNDAMCQILGYTREELLSMLPDELLDEEGRERFRDRTIKRLAGEKISEQTEYRVKTKDGHEIWGVLNITMNYQDGEARSVSVIAHDVTERKRAEQLSHALNWVNDSIHSTLDLDEVMQRALDQAANTLGCDTAAISLWDGNTWVVRYVHNLPLDIIGMQMKNEEERHALLALQTKLPVAVNDAFNDERVNREHLRKWGIRSVLTIPLIIKDKASGVIFFNYQRSQNVFADYQIDFAVKLSASLSLAIENARLFDELQTELAERQKAEQALLENQKQLRLLNETLEQKVQEKTAEVRRLASDLTKAEQRERHRISQVLHEDLQQRLFAIQMQIALFREQIQRGDESANTDLAHIKEQLDEMLVVTRRLSIDLSPPILQNEGLFQAISWLASQMKEQHGLQTKVQGQGSFAIPDTDLQVLVYNCVRELLTNVVLHAGVKEAVVLLQRSGENVQVEVRDRGKGFVVDSGGQPVSVSDQSEEHRSSLSLATIRHQLSLFGGSMEVQSAPGAGTRVILIVPVSKGL